MYKDFEDYLIEKHSKQYCGTDDLMPEDFEEWLQDLDVNEIIKYANEYKKTGG